MSRRFSTVVVVLGLPVVGTVLGGFIGGRLSAGDIGFDQIGSVMGGLATGLLAGLILAIALVRRLGERKLERVAILTGLAVLIASVTLYIRFRGVPQPATGRPAIPVATPN